MTLRQANKEIYWAWKSMKQRCQNPKCQAYHNYGARGIMVCDELQSFEPFCEWALKNGYQKGLDMDRIDNDGNYCPENCRWTDRRTNTLNRRMTIYLTIDGITKPGVIWAEEVGIPKYLISSWVYVHGIDFATKRVKDALENGYVRNNYMRDHIFFKVKLKETGEVFPSMAEAARHFHLPKSQVYKSVHRRKETDVGHFELIEKVIHP